MNPPVTPSRPYAESLSGLIERVTYFNEENGFVVLEVLLDEMMERPPQ